MKELGERAVKTLWKLVKINWIWLGLQARRSYSNERWSSQISQGR